MPTGTLAKDVNSTEPVDDVLVPILAAMDYVFAAAGTVEPKMLMEAMTWPDAMKWLEVVYSELQAHIINGTWELMQLPPSRCAIGSWWVFKVKRQPDRSIDKYKGQIV